MEMVFKKGFYNLYNFTKSPERLLPIGIWILGLIALFTKKNQQEKTFALLTTILTVLFLGAATLSLPNARYIHPITPLWIILAMVGLFNISKHTSAKVVVITVVILFISIPDIGNLTLDQRYWRTHTNLSQSPVTRVISSEIAKSVPTGKLVITNLDAWAAWYEGLSTMWFPLAPDHLQGYQEKISYIVITNYLEADADFALRAWSEVVYNPDSISNEFLNENFEVLRKFVIQPSQNFEGQTIRGTILVNKNI